MSETLTSEGIETGQMPQAPDPAPAPELKQKGPTSYVILEKITIETPGEPDHYVILTEGVEAKGNISAIKAAKITDPAGRTFIAIPERSFKEVPVKVKTTEQLVFS
jgi:hypothetical protein